MVEANASTASRMARVGMPLITPTQGLAALASTLTQLHQGTCLSQLAALPLDTFALLEHGNLPAMTVPLLADLAVTMQSASKADSLLKAGISAVGKPVKHAQNLQLVLETVSSAVSAVLGGALPPIAPLMAAGLDSLALVELTNALQVGLGMQLPPTLVFDYPTIQAIAEFVCQDTAPEATGALTVPRPAVLLKPASDDQAFTLVSDVVSYSPHDSLVSLTPCDSIGQVPLDRWDLEGHPEVANAARFGAFLRNADSFDAACFGISHAEAVLMDPQQRLLLQAVGQATIMTSQATSMTASVQQGMYIGIAPSDYASLLKQHTDRSSFHATANASSVACGRLSYTFGLKGPSMSIDTACSSSLVAVHLAHTGIVGGQAEVSYAAGVHLQCTAASTSYVWTAGMLSSSGRCQVLPLTLGSALLGLYALPLALLSALHFSSFAQKSRSYILLSWHCASYYTLLS